MEKIIIFLIIVQALATAVGAFFLAKKARNLKVIVTQVSGIAFVLPFMLYLIPYSFNPTAEKMAFFIEWLIYSFIANEIVAIPTVFIAQIFRR